MDKEKLRFSAAIIVGFVVMLLFAMITVNIMQLIPIVGPFVGGLVAGLIAVKDFLNAAKAVLIAEDDKFWQHEGFDLEAMQKAIEKDIKLGKLKYGGSTISQQLAKNLFLSPSKNPLRKVKEAILTWRIENNLSKRRILELYLNVAEWGDGIFGIEAASRHYYGKSAAELTPMEAARLVVVLPNPLKYNPTGTSKYVEKRAEIVYGIMVRRGIVIEEYEDIMKAPPDEPLPDTGAPRPPGQTSGTVDVADKKESVAAEKAGEKPGALLPASKEGR
jgi:monofunctional biosynthetic peptidoglycan transglycosylase